MVQMQPKYRFLRHLIMSMAMLWAILIPSTGTYAADSTPQAATDIAQMDSVSSEASAAGLQQGMLYLAEEGTAATLTFSLQQPATVSKAQAIWFPTNKAIPPYAARAPGDNFFCKFFYTSSQPQAP